MTLKIFLLFALMSSATAVVKLREIFSWNVLDWNFLSPFARQQAIQTGAFIPENALPIGIERWRNRLFVTVPRWSAGIPATLNYIPLDAPYNPSPKLIPYPSFAGNELGNCQNGLNTVYRIKADQCDRLWVIDTGTYGINPNVTNLCPFTLNVYDLNTDQRIRRYVFRPDDIVSTTLITNIALDEGRTCEDTFAYFSDELGNGLIAYSWEQNRSWRFSHGYFMADPLVGDYNIGGLNFQWSASGIFGITTSPVGVDGFRTLYFSPLSSNTQFAVSTRVLRDESRVTNSYRDFRIVGVRGNNGHTTSKVMDERTGIEFFNLVDQNAIGCWRQDLPYNPQNIGIVDRDDTELIFPSDIKIDHDRNVWVLSDRLPVFLESALDYNDFNFRIFTAPVDFLAQQTVCETRFTNSQTIRQQNNNFNNGFGVTVTSRSFGNFSPLSTSVTSRPFQNFPPVSTSVTSRSFGNNFFPVSTSGTSRSFGNFLPVSPSPIFSTSQPNFSTPQPNFSTPQPIFSTPQPNFSTTQSSLINSFNRQSRLF